MRLVRNQKTALESRPNGRSTSLGADCVDWTCATSAIQNGSVLATALGCKILMAAASVSALKVLNSLALGAPRQRRTQGSCLNHQQITITSHPPSTKMPRNNRPGQRAILVRTVGIDITTY